MADEYILNSEPDKHSSIDFREQKSWTKHKKDGVPRDSPIIFLKNCQLITHGRNPWLRTGLQFFFDNKGCSDKLICMSTNFIGLAIE